MTRAKSRHLTGYLEKHHIIPKCFGGTNDTCNIARLTAREHFIAHLLLVKFTHGQNKSKMSFALNMMTINAKKHNRYVPSSKIYEIVKKNFSIAQKAKVVSDQTRMKIGNAHRGKTVSDETKQKISRARKDKPGCKHTQEWKDLMSNKMKLNRLSLETKQKIGAKHKGKIISEEQKRKMVETSKARYKSKHILVLCSPNGEIFAQKPNQTSADFCHSLGLKYASIKKAYDEKRKIRNGWTVISLTKNEF